MVPRVPKTCDPSDECFRFRQAEETHLRNSRSVTWERRVSTSILCWIWTFGAVGRSQTVSPKVAMHVGILVASNDAFITGAVGQHHVLREHSSHAPHPSGRRAIPLRVAPTPQPLRTSGARATARPGRVNRPQPNIRPRVRSAPAMMSARSCDRASNATMTTLRPRT